jgi:hypothetical protein
MAVFPVPGCPPISTARPAILPSLIMLRMIPAARLASPYDIQNTGLEKVPDCSIEFNLPAKSEFIEGNFAYLADHTL